MFSCGVSFDAYVYLIRFEIITIDIFKSLRINGHGSLTNHKLFILYCKATCLILKLVVQYQRRSSSPSEDRSTHHSSIAPYEAYFKRYICASVLNVVLRQSQLSQYFGLYSPSLHPHPLSSPLTGRPCTGVHNSTLKLK